MDYHALALRRMMAERGLTLRQVVAATGLHERTVKAVLRGNSKPHARTLHQLSRGLKFDAADFFPPADPIYAVTVSRRDKPILDQVAKLLDSDSRDVLVGMVKIMARQLETAPVGETVSAGELEPCAATS